MLSALSPLDGRYSESMEELRAFFSEEALIRARVFIEISYFAALAKEKKIKELKPLKPAQEKALQKIIDEFSTKDAEEVKKIEETTRHDVKAVEYFLKKKIAKIPGLKDSVEFVHFALTSEDTNNLAYGILIHQAVENVLAPALLEALQDLAAMAVKWKTERMLSLTHGQPATPTTVGKEMLVFGSRLQKQLAMLDGFRMQGKFGGAVGSYSAHEAAYPDVDWGKFGEEFVSALGLTPVAVTTQINPHDDIAELSHLFIRINTILLDLSRDMWLYISRGVFKQKVVKGEVGSSTMPHKVNPIDFENGEGNLGLSTALFDHFALKLPVSRLQRDLSDSTVQRNIGVAFGYHLLAVKNIRKGFSKLTLDISTLQRELDTHPEVAAEAIQTVLRKHGVEGAYEQLKDLTRGEKLTKADLKKFVEELKLPEAEKKRLAKLI